MDIKLLLIRIITLLFIESLFVKKGGSSSKPSIKSALGYIKMPEASHAGDFNKDSVTRLRELVQWMLEQPQDHEFNKNDLLQRLRIATETDDFMYDAAASIIQPEQTDKELKDQLRTAKDYIDQFINKSIVTDIVKEAYYQAAFKPGEIDWTTYVANLMNKVEPYRTLGVKDHSTRVAAIDLTNIASLQGGFEEGLKTLSNDGIIRFGWKGFNRMFGSMGGARRGDMIVVGALQYNFKSGTSLELVKAAALYNKPFMLDPTKKPLILRLSLENPAIIDICLIYKSMIEAETMTKVRENDIDPIIAARYVSEKLGRNGYNVIFEQHNPSELTYDKLFGIIEGYENDGYEIHMVNIDYLAMMSTKGCKQGATGQDIRDLFRRVRNFLHAKKITCITPHQLSVEAKKKTREGVIASDFVREIANKGYWDSCSTIDQEVDMEIYQHLVPVNGDKYITWMRGKHRGVNDTSPEDLYTVYMFSPYGTIHDDVMLEVDFSRKRVGSASKSDGGEAAWWDQPEAA